MKFKTALPNYTDFINNIVIEYQKLYVNFVPVVGWEYLFNVISEWYKDEELMLDPPKFFIKFKNLLLTKLPVYNEAWKVAISDYVKNLSVEELISFGSINTSDDTQKVQTTPGLVDPVNNYTNSIVSNKIKGQNLNVGVLNNISRVVNSRVDFSKIEALLKDLLPLFSFEMNIMEDVPVEDKIYFSDITNDSDVPNANNGKEAIDYLYNASKVPGPKGDKGEKGDTGPIGPKGDKGDKGEPGTGGGSNLGVLNNETQTFDNAISNFPAPLNLKEGNDIVFEPYANALLPQESQEITPGVSVMRIPKGDIWAGGVSFTNKKIGWYLYKHNFFFKLNPFTSVNKEFKITFSIQTTTGLIDTYGKTYNLNKLTNEEIQKHIFNFNIKTYVNLKQLANYQYNIFIQGLNDSFGTLLILTENPDPDIDNFPYPEGSSIRITELIPQEDKETVFDNKIKLNDLNDYTAFGYKPDPVTNDNLIPLLQYAIKYIPDIILFNKLFTIGESPDGNITKADLNHQLELLTEASKPTELPNLRQVEALITAGPTKDKQTIKDINSLILSDSVGSKDIRNLPKDQWTRYQVFNLDELDDYDKVKLVFNKFESYNTSFINNFDKVVVEIPYRDIVETTDVLKEIKYSLAVPNKTSVTGVYPSNTYQPFLRFNLTKNAGVVYLNILNNYLSNKTESAWKNINVSFIGLKLKGVEALKGRDGADGDNSTFLLNKFSMRVSPLLDRGITLNNTHGNIESFDEVKIVFTALKYNDFVQQEYIFHIKDYQATSRAMVQIVNFKLPTTDTENPTVYDYDLMLTIYPSTSTGIFTNAFYLRNLKNGLDINVDISIYGVKRTITS